MRPARRTQVDALQRQSRLIAGPVRRLSTRLAVRSPKQLGETMSASDRAAGAGVDIDAVLAASSAFPVGIKPPYGTGGFRAEGSQLESTLFRCGSIAAVRAMSTRKRIGLMVTASHNPEPDNGVKLIDPDGSMFPVELEGPATAVVWAERPEELRSSLETLVARSQAIATHVPMPLIDGPGEGPRVIVAHDTRPTSEALAAAAVRGIEAAGCRADLRGLLTTPQCHFAVWCSNRGRPETEDYYFDTLVSGFRALTHAQAGARPRAVAVDCANGVGAPKMAELATRLMPHGLALSLRNAGEGRLNHLCGADYVQKAKRAPPGFEAAGSGGYSVDGDADRAVYFETAAVEGQAGEGGVLLFDGDRIAALLASEVKALMDRLPGLSHGRLGVVQTAYANGASTAYLKDSMGCEVVCTKTGVKHLHAAAVQFDVGVYFEANGHGSVLFSEALLTELRALVESGPEESAQAAQELLAFSDMVNQSVGDALSILLAVEAVRMRRGWATAQWASMYRDLPAAQFTVRVKDRFALKTSEDETRLLAPAGLQPRIDECLAAHPGSRAFFRPSGTEDVVRGYIEAPSEATVADLRRELETIVVEHLSS